MRETLDRNSLSTNSHGAVDERDLYRHVVSVWGEWEAVLTFPTYHDYYVKQYMAAVAAGKWTPRKAA